MTERTIGGLWVGVCLSTVALNAAFGWSLRDELARAHHDALSLLDGMTTLNTAAEDLLQHDQVQEKRMADEVKSLAALDAHVVTLLHGLDVKLERFAIVSTPDAVFRHAILDSHEAIMDQLDALHEQIKRFKDHP